MGVISVADTDPYGSASFLLHGSESVWIRLQPKSRKIDKKSKIKYKSHLCLTHINN